jgi:Na+/melibiose symporter-like transporter
MTEKLSFKEKFAFSLGAVPNGFFGIFLGAIQAFYYSWMGLDIKYIVITQVLYSIWNAVNDPIFGLAMDRTRSKHGRFIPWIKRFFVPLAVSFVLIFFPPQIWRLADGGQSYQLILAAWYLLTQVFYDTCFTIVYMAFYSLMPQMTMLEKERRDINILVSVMTFIGAGIAGVFPLISLTNPTAESIVQFQQNVLIFAALSLLPWLGIILFVKEKKEFIPEEQTTAWENIKYVFKNKSALFYMVYDSISVGFMQVFVIGMVYLFGWVWGFDNPYNAQPWSFADGAVYLIPSLVGLLVGIKILMWIPKKYDVKTALIFSMGTEALGMIIAFIGVITSPNLSASVYNVPVNLWAIGIGMGITFLGFSGDFIYHNVMRSETIDYDEYVTGERRESVYVGIASVFSKLMISATLIAVPAIINKFGLVPTEDLAGPALIVEYGFKDATIGVAVAVLLLPGLMAFIGAVVFAWYPLNRQKLDEIRPALELMHQEKRAARLGE